MPGRRRAVALFAFALALALACAHACAHAARPPPPSAPAGEHLAMVEGAAGRLRVSDGGAGDPAVVFLHGLGSELEVWRAQLEHVRRTHRAVAYDQRGHGGSERPRDGVYTLAALAEDLAAVRRALGLGRVVIVAHDLSGAVLTTYLAAHPEDVAGAVYLDAIGDFDALPPERLAEVVARERSPSFGAAQRRADVAQALVPRARPETLKAVLAALGRMDPAAYPALRRDGFQLRDAAARVAGYRGPALAVEAAENPFAPLLAGPVLALPRVEVQGVSHWLQLDDPEAVNRALDGFLARLPAAR